jgi:hypothetical protein
MTSALAPERLEPNLILPNMEDHYDALEVDLLKCPKCNGVEPTYNLDLQAENLSIKIKCTHCRASIENKKWLCKCNKPWALCGLHFRKCMDQRRKIKIYGRGIIGCEPIMHEDHDGITCRTHTIGRDSLGTGDLRTRTTSGGTGVSLTRTKREASAFGMGDSKIKRRLILPKPTFFQSTLERMKLKRKAYFLVEDRRDGRPTKLGPILAGRFSFCV